MGAGKTIQTNFLGGEWSKAAQGRFDEADYRTAMNVCLNAMPLEEGAWCRRSGTQNAGHTKNGNPGRVIKFDFSTVSPYTVELTDGFMRFRTGTTLINTNDGDNVVAISTANPAVVQMLNPHIWQTNDTIFFTFTIPARGSIKELTNRQFIITRIDSTHFSLADALTGATIDGSTVSPVLPGTFAVRVQEIASPYAGGSWATVRFVQAETTAVVLQGIVPPQLLQVTTLPTVAGVQAQFSLGPITFLDGPYLDPFTNGVQAVPNGLSGNITLTLQFPAYLSTQAYKVGDFVTSVGINYISLQDDNVNNTPAGSPTFWATTSAGAAINNGQGFLGTDIGRLIRLRSEPAAWSSTTAYVAGNLVTYAGTYFTALVGNTNKVPGSDTTNWALSPQFSIPVTSIIIGGSTQAVTVATWSWGKIISLANEISRVLAGSVNIGDMTANGGLAAAFDGVTNQANTLCAAKVFGGGTTNGSAFVGKNYTGAAAQQISSGTIWPSTNFGWTKVTSVLGPGSATGLITINLRAKASAPANSSDGTLLGSVGGIGSGSTIAISILSNDQVTAWNYVWFEIIEAGNTIGNLNIFAAECKFFNPAGTGGGAAVNIELLGPPLLYTTPIVNWRLGTYSNTTGFPTCGTYHEGRIWLGGAVNNRFDASVSNGLVGTTLNFAPTDVNGFVTGNSALNYTLNSDGVNPILWMEPDQQGVLMGTLAGEWLISAPTQGAITAVNIAGRRVTKIGVSNSPPVRTDHTLLFIQRFSRRLMEYFADIFSGKFNAPNIAHRAFQIVKNGMAELTYVTSKTPTVWGRNTDGSWWGITYKRDTLTTSQGPTTFGWHRHQLGSGRTVESIAFSPSVGGALDTIAMVTNDPVTNIRHVEVLSDLFDEGSSITVSQFIDDAILPFVTPVIVGGVQTGVLLSGLTLFNGNTVTVVFGGLDVGDFVVANGAVTVPFGLGIDNTGADQFTQAYFNSIGQFGFLVGFTYTSDGQIVRPMVEKETGTKVGQAAMANIRRAHWWGAQFVDAGFGLKMGTDFNHLRTVYFKSLGGKSLTVKDLFTGIDTVPLDDTYSFDSMICWRQTRPYPVTIAAIGEFLHTQDK